jgi:HEAT repeat protein
LGITHKTVCLACRVRAPDLGDFGRIGLPILDPAPRKGEEQSFGFIYEGLREMGMLALEVEAFAAFLKEHDGHRLAFASDGQIDEYGGSDADAAVERWPSRTRSFRFSKRGFVQARYQLRCERCDSVVSSSDSHLLRPFDPLPLTNAKRKAFAERVVAEVEEGFRRTGVFPEQDASVFAEFLEEHEGHPITASLRREAAVRARKLGPPEPATPSAREDSPPQPPEVPLSEIGRELGLVSDAEVLDTLQRLRDRDPAVREAAAAELGRIADAATLGYLVSMLDDAEPAVRAAAVRAVGTVAPGRRGLRAVGQALLDESEEVRRAAEAAAASAGFTAAEALDYARRPVSPAGDPALSKRNVPPEAFQHPSPSVRFEAFWFGKPESVPLLVRALADPSWLVRDEAAQGLAKQKSDAAVPALSRALRDYHASVVSAAMKALGAARADAAVPAMTQALSRPEYGVRSAAFEGLAAIGSPSAIEALVQALQDRDPEMRGQAAHSLGKLKTQAAVDALVARLQAPDTDDRRVAAYALLAIGGALVLEPMLGLLNGPDPDLRQAAAFALSSLDDVRARPALLDAARRGDAAVAAVAWKVLVAAGDPETEAALVAAVKHFGDERDEVLPAFLGSGNPRLAEAAREVYRREGRPVPRPSSRVAWGSRKRR